MPAKTTLVRCAWCGDDPLYVAYHDREWGVPEHDDARLFEKLILDGAQAGLSWITILRKRENYRRAFHGFDADKIARYGPRDVARLLGDAGIVRNSLKIESAIGNARAYLALRERGDTLDDFLWRHVDYAPLQRRRASVRDIPATSPESDRLSKDLKKAGFSFVGSTIVYAFMQAAGLVNDHVVDCFRHSEIARAGRRAR